MVLQNGSYSTADMQLARMVMETTDTHEILAHTITDPLPCLTAAKRQYETKASLELQDARQVFSTTNSQWFLFLRPALCLSGYELYP